jgi:hypothetical protein
LKRRTLRRELNTPVTRVFVGLDFWRERDRLRQMIAVEP